MKKTIFRLVIALLIIGCAQHKNSIHKKEVIFNDIHEFSANKLDSVKIYGLSRVGMETYNKSATFYKLTHSEIVDLIKQLKNDTNFYGGTPLSFRYTSTIEFYSKNKLNRIYSSPDAFKVSQLDFKISHNKKEEIESLEGAISFPFIKNDFAQFLKQLEKKIR